MSYTPGRIAYALARAPVGIDIEILRPDFDWQRVAPLVLPAEDLERLHRAPRGDRAAAFLRAWTRHEAIGKATGAGLLSGPQPPAALLLATEPLALDSPHVATVARVSRRLRLRTMIDALPAPFDPAVVLSSSNRSPLMNEPACTRTPARNDT